MSTLTYGHRTFAPAAPEAEKAPRKSLWRRFADNFMEVQQRRAEREVARYLANHGGLLTDDMEREIMLRLTHNGRKTL